jgi:hypothetical protein
LPIRETIGIQSFRTLCPKTREIGCDMPRFLRHFATQ